LSVVNSGLFAKIALMSCRITLASLVSCVALGASLAGYATPAYAQFRVCNQSINLFNVAVGRRVDGVFKIEGWWTVPANVCITPIKDDLKDKYIYLHVLSITGEDLLPGNRTMCIKPGKFIYIHDGSATFECWARGYQQAKFTEIYTGERATSWTVFVKQPAVTH
jgi:uncharacterized membrane protein